MLSSILLPESFTEITFSGLRKEESNIVSNLGVAGFLEQHLGILLFYVFIYSVTVLGVLSQLSENLRRFLSIRKFFFPVHENLRCFGYVDVLTFGEIILGGAMVLLMGSETLYFTYMHQYTQRSGDSNTEHSARVAGSLAKVSMRRVPPRSLRRPAGITLLPHSLVSAALTRSQPKPQPEP
jgi:hypothetical protein